MRTASSPDLSAEVSCAYVPGIAVMGMIGGCLARVFGRTRRSFVSARGLYFARVLKVQGSKMPTAPNFTPTSSQFGMITGKSGLNRQLQLSLRFYF